MVCFYCDKTINLRNRYTDNLSAGNRWHIECFSCNICGTILDDSDANLRLLDDSSLICNDCAYSCNGCNNKIEDLAIITEDKAFCVICFKCRHCKKRIENLKYARTSEGISCMDCHESLMERHWKRLQEKASNCRRKDLTEGRQAEQTIPKSPTKVQHPFSKEPPTLPYEAIQELRDTISSLTTLATVEPSERRRPTASSKILPFIDIDEQIHNQAREKDSTGSPEELELTSTLLPAAPLDPLSPSQAQAVSSPQSHEWVKIEDLFFFSRDQYSCVVRFKCRSCKKKIENLEYARTPQGIVCMNCNEASTPPDAKASEESLGQEQTAERHEL